MKTEHDLHFIFTDLLQEGDGRLETSTAEQAVMLL